MDRFHIDLIAAIFVYTTMRKRWPYWCTKKSPLGIELFSFVKPSFAQKKKKIIAVDHVCENDLLKPYKMYKCFFSLNDLETHFPFSFGCKCFREQSLIDRLSSANQNVSFSGRDLSQKKNVRLLVLQFISLAYSQRYRHNHQRVYMWGSSCFHGTRGSFLYNIIYNISHLSIYGECSA